MKTGKSMVILGKVTQVEKSNSSSPSKTGNLVPAKPPTRRVALSFNNSNSESLNHLDTIRHRIYPNYGFNEQYMVGHWWAEQD